MATATRTVLSAVSPTNPLTLGNLVGAVRNWARFQANDDAIFFAVDQHAITLRQNPEELRENTYRAMAAFIASGIDPERSTLFVQSHVPEHTELAWVLTCNSYIGELNRMTQYKDKAAKQGTNIPAGLFVYPVLMAADILLYQAHKIPVGHDQIQHVELTRDLAIRMNHAYQQELFTVPEAFIPEVGARIMSLQDPSKKMSKSDSDPKATVYLTDSDKEIEKKIKSAVTDSGEEVRLSDESPGVKNLLTIQAALRNIAPEALVQEYAGKKYGHLKVDTAEVVISSIRPVRDEMQRLLNDRASLEQILAKGAARARERARKTVDRVQAAVGFAPRVSLR
jgi:tryptophanyl-tRNA synthetase